jgi:exonuclease SbcC
MKILSIAITNLRLHADTRITLAPRGVTGIVGANATGKSTVLEALLWSFFGATATRGTKESLRWHGAPARRGASVVIEFSIGGKLYRLERGESTAKLTEAGTGTVLAEGTSAVTDFVPKILGMSYDEFRASFMCSQKDLARLTSMGGTERTAFIRQVLGVGKIDTGLADCRKRKNALESKVEGMGAGLGEREPLAADVLEADKAFVTRQAGLGDAKAKRDLASNEAQDAEALFRGSEKLKEEHAELTRTAATARQGIAHADSEIVRLTAAEASQVVAAEKVAEEQPLIDALPGLRNEHKALVEAKAYISGKATLTERVEQLTADIAHEREVIADAQNQIDFYDADEHQASSKRFWAAREKFEALRGSRIQSAANLRAEGRSYDVQADNLRKQVDALRELGTESACPTCTRPLGKGFDSVVGNLNEQANAFAEKEADCFRQEQGLQTPPDDEIEAEVASDAAEAELEVWITRERDAARAQVAVVQRSAAIEKMEAEIEAATARLDALPAAGFDEERYVAVCSEIQVLENKDRALLSFRSAAGQLEHTRSEIVRWQAAGNEDARAAEEATRAAAALGFDEERHLEAVYRHNRANEAAGEARTEVARLTEAVKAAHDRFRAAQDALVAYDDRADALRVVRDELRRHERAADVLADFRVSVAGVIRPELEELMSGFVATLTDGRHESVTLSEDFTPTLQEAGIPTEIVSGGTEDVAALALRLAISQMIAERAGHPLELLILDEPFGSLDEVRRGNVLSLIRRLSGVFEQVIVISHVAETRDSVDHVIELEHDVAGGMARVVSAPSVVAGAA